MWELKHGDLRDVLPTLGAGTVDAIVTSPPYADQRVYEGGDTLRRNSRAPRDNGKLKNQSRRQRSEAPMLFATDFIETKLPVLFEALTDRGSLMLNLGVVFRDGEESPYADVILAAARAMGFKLLHRMIWHKPNGNTLSDARFLRVSHEWVFWLAKDVDAYRGYDRETRTPHAESSIRRIREPFIEDSEDERYRKRGSGDHRLHPDGARPTTVFRCGVGGERGIKHPAPMPLKLARHCVALSAEPGALVVDPYCGSGTTGVACIELGREFIGIDREAPYLEEARDRLEGALFSPTVHPEQTSLEILGT